MDFLIIEMLKVSSVLCTGAYGLVFIGQELFSTSLPIGLCLIGILPILLSFLRVRPPSKKHVEAVIGKDPVNVNDEDDNDKNVYVLRTVAHRGAGLDAPENSSIAFALCTEKGCDAVEFDVRLTADEVPIVYHDDSLIRMTDMPKDIKNSTWAELSEIDISVKHPLRERFRNTFIATLDTIVTQCLRDRQRMFIDLKEMDTKIVLVILKLYKKYPELYNMAVCTSFYPHLIYLIRRADPAIVCAIAWRPYFYSHESFSSVTGKGNPRSAIWLIRLFHCFVDKFFEWAVPQVLYYILGISVILLNKEAISGEVIYKWRCKGVRVMAWTVNHPIEKQFFSRNYKITYLTDTLIGESSAHFPIRKGN